MFRSRVLQAPIITILSPCLTASKKAVSLLSLLGNMERISLFTGETSSSDKVLSNIFKSSIPGSSRSWDSIGAKCPITGSVVNFCSISNPGTQKEYDDGNPDITPFALLGITDDKMIRNDGSEVDVDIKAAIRHFWKLLGSRISNRATLHSALSNLKLFLGGNVTTDDLLKNISRDGLPLLSIPDRSSDGNSRNPDMKSEIRILSTSSPFLKEIVVPHFDHATYIDGSTLISKLSLSLTHRPAVGVFQWPNSSTCIRPLPTAAEDHRLPSPSLIFHCESSDDAIMMRKYGFRDARIGYGGLGPDHGQVMLLHEDLRGIDVRYCPRQTISSTFSEAQESLLAGSLDELQSKNILISEGENVKDERIGNGDCWVEVRANIKRPSNYWHRSKSRSKQKVAKIPDLPFE